MSAALDYRSRALSAEARVVELEEELAAYRDRDRRGGLTEAQITRNTAVVEVLRRILPGLQHAPQVARLLQCIAARPGHVFIPETLAAAICLKDPGELVTLKVVDVTVCHARKVLRLVGLDDAITTVWGKGYRLNPDRAEVLCETLGLPHEA